MADFNINLARTMVSSPEERQRFYHRMLIYLAVCAAGLVYTAYFSAVNITKAVQVTKKRQMLIASDSAVSAYSKTFYRDPDTAFAQLESRARDMEVLRDLISKRAHFLPVLNQLFADFPENMSVQGLRADADSRKIMFDLVAPLLDEQGESAVSKLQARWKSNEVLLELTRGGIRQISSERDLVDSRAIVYVVFECILK